MPLEPNNVYSATKASAEMLVRSFHKTYGLDVVTTRCCNNYGPRQDKEKLIPKVISNALNNDPIPVYGKGDNIREWIHVHDHCTAIKCIFDCGSTGEIYNIGSGVELQNLHLVKRILSITNRPESLIQFVKDRKGHDFRYSLNFDKLSRLGWYPEYGDMDMMMEGLQETVEWFKKSS
jgi:dTDP-glucose 4,6-dehydratase